MKVHNLNIDSSQRQSNVHPYANTYVIHLENPIYDVSQVKLISARIPTPQLTTCASNKSFSVDGTVITLDETNYSSGTVLASDLAIKLAPPGSNVDSVVFDTDTNGLVFSNTIAGDNDFTFEFHDGTNGHTSTSSSVTTPHQVLGFGSIDHASTNKVLRSGAINLDGPNSLVLKVTSGSDGFDQDVYTSTPFYTGHILLNGSDVVNFNGSDDPIIHHFHSGPQKFIKELTIEFFYMSHGRLIPYDFRNQDHLLKFEVTCSTDKLANLTKVVLDDVLPKKEEKSLISIPEEFKNPYNREVFVYIGVITFLGILLISFMKRKI